MSYSEKKITQAEVDARNVKSAPDVLVGNAGDNKQVFDSLPEYIVEKYNSLMDDLDGTQGDIDADISSIESDIDAINETLGTKADNVDFAGATATQAGEHGLVPPLAAGNRKHVLFGSGQWHQLDIDAWQNNSSVNVGLTTDKSTSGTYIRYSTASIPVATPTQPGAMSATDKGKLDNIAEGAEVNVQPDWNDTDTSSDAYIKNKPTIDATLDPDSANAVQNRAIVEALDQKADDEYTQQQFTLISGYLNGKVDKVSGKGLSTNDYTTAEKNKLAGIATGAEVNVQSDWNQANTSADDYIKNKPTIVTPADLNAAITAEQTAREQADSEIETIALNAYINKTASGAIATFADGSDAPMKSCIVSIVPKQAGSGTPSPDNERPISGWESVNLYKSGKNLFNKANAIELYCDGSTRLMSNATFKSVYIPLSPNTNYVYSQSVFGNYTRLALCNSLEAGTSIYSPVTKASGYEQTTPLAFTNTDFKYLVCTIYRSTTDTNTFDEIADSCMLELGTTATDYEPYNGTTTTVNLGRTVYGGEAEIVGGSLTDKMAMVDLGTLNWSTPTASGRCSASLGAKPPTSSTDLSNLICSDYETITVRQWYDASKEGVTICGAGYGSNGNCGICDSRLIGKTSAEVATILNGVQLVYELATPQTYTLTPTEVKTLLGENNVWADSGDVEVVYRADPTLAYQELANAITALGGNV